MFLLLDSIYCSHSMLSRGTTPGYLHCQLYLLYSFSHSYSVLPWTLLDSWVFPLWCQGVCRYL